MGTITASDRMHAMHRVFLRIAALLVLLSLGTGFARASFDGAWQGHASDHAVATALAGHDHDSNEEGGSPLGEADHASAHAAAQAIGIPGGLFLYTPAIHAHPAPAAPPVVVPSAASFDPPFRPPRLGDA